MADTCVRLASRPGLCQTCIGFKPVFHLANLFARREAKTRIRQRDWLTLVGEKIRREQVGTVPTFFLFARTNSPSGKRALDSVRLLLTLYGVDCAY